MGRGNALGTGSHIEVLVVVDMQVRVVEPVGHGSHQTSHHTTRVGRNTYDFV